VRNLLFLIAILFASVFLVDWLEISTQRRVEFQIFNPNSKGTGSGDHRAYFTEAQFPVVLDLAESQSLMLRVHTSGYITTGRLELTFGGGAVEVAHKDRVVALNSDYGDCKPRLSEGALTCVVLIRTLDLDNEDILIVPAAGRVKIDTVSFTVIQEKRGTSLKGNVIYAIYGGLALLGPLFAWLGRTGRQSLLIFPVISLGFIAFLSVEAAVFLMLFLIYSYLVLLWVNTGGRRKARLLATVLSGFALILLFVKLVLPNVGSMFANPGGFWFALPLGFSYFVIKLVDLTISCYSGAVKKLSLLDYVAFLLFPATLPAGPIFTYDGFKKARIQDYAVTDFSAGVARVLVGLGKKLVADVAIFPYVSASTAAFILAPDQVSSWKILSMLVANFIFVYLDFSGYSDMAIGAGRSMGWRVPENFDYPLARTRLRQYWQHWHMTLSNWVMRRVFVSAVLASRSTVLATFVSMLTIGLWHHLSLTWFLWALHHSTIMTIEEILGKRIKPATTARQPQGPRRGRWVLHTMSIAYVWIAVSLGHSFTMFSNLEFSLRAYMRAVSAPAELVARGYERLDRAISKTD
jgi:D-alanyl-lipoteichoic acid acyltransferase DltB (MBOAT superfamily)